MKHFVTKTYGHELGLSCAFRQWRAKSHCSRIHGYPLSFRFVFGAEELDECGWVVDFGGLKRLKSDLTYHFDHTLAVAADDPELPYLSHLIDKGVADVRVWASGVGCERFAEAAYRMAETCVGMIPGAAERGVFVNLAECREHGANSAIFQPTPLVVAPRSPEERGR